MWVEKVTKHRIGEIIERQAWQTKPVERFRVSATAGNKIEVHAGQTGDASSHAAALYELAVKLGIERAENLLPTQRSPAIVLRRNTGSLSIRSTLWLSSRPAVCCAGVSFATSD